MENLTCQWPSCTATLTYRGRGRPPKWCDDHKGAAAREQRKSYPRESRTSLCTVDDCGRGIVGRGMCNMHWRRWARATGRERTPAWNEQRRARWKARFAAKRNAVSEVIVYQDVFVRDRWICGICGTSVDPLLEYPDPFSASLDHVIPLSKGGTHTYSNVQCSHLRCNVGKGADLDGTER